MSPEQELEDESLIYADKEPDIGALTDAYDTCLIDLDYYFESCLRSYNDRRNIWDGKSDDLRKNGANAFPWQGASAMKMAYLLFACQFCLRAFSKPPATSSGMSPPPVAYNYFKNFWQAAISSLKLNTSEIFSPSQ